MNLKIFLLLNNTFYKYYSKLFFISFQNNGRQTWAKIDSVQLKENVTLEKRECHDKKKVMLFNRGCNSKLVMLT